MVTYVSFKKLFCAFIVPLVALTILIIVLYLYFDGMYNNIKSDWANHKADVAKIISKYPNRFSPADVNSTRYDVNSVTSAMAVTALDIINSIMYQLLVSIIVALAINLTFAIGNAKNLPDTYNVANFDQTQHWISSGTGVLTATSAAVTVGTALVGAVSLLSPNLVGGFVLSGLLALLVCIVLGILNQAYGGGVVKKSNAAPAGNTVAVKPVKAAFWAGFTAMHFAMLITGISLIILQVIIS